MSFGTSALSDWSNIYQRYTQQTQHIRRWQNTYNNESHFSVQSTNDIPTSVDLSGVTIDDLMDEPKRPAQRVAREEPTLMEVWAD